MTMQLATRRRLVEPSIEARREALEHSYPGWRIAYDPTKGQWSASKRAPITDAQADAGVVDGFFSTDYEMFVDLLVQQADPHAEQADPHAGETP